MKKYIFILCVFFNISGAMAIVPPTACPAGEIAYNLPDTAVSIVYNQCPSDTLFLGTYESMPYIFLIAQSNTPYTDTIGTYEYQNLVCVYK